MEGPRRAQGMSTGAKALVYQSSDISLIWPRFSATRNSSRLFTGRGKRLQQVLLRQSQVRLRRRDLLHLRLGLGVRVLGGEHGPPVRLHPLDHVPQLRPHRQGQAPRAVHQEVRAQLHRGEAAAALRVRGRAGAGRMNRSNYIVLAILGCG